jgi:curved DNA-binding protein
MFTELTKAYGVLRDPEKRADYDRSYFTIAGKGAGNATLGVDIQEDQKNAVKDAEMHHNILLALYKRRREHPKDPGLSGWLLQELLHCSEDNLEFHVWYLKSSGYIDNTEQGTLAITIQGVDRVISTSRNTLSEKLLIAQLAEPDR